MLRNLNNLHRIADKLADDQNNEKLQKEFIETLKKTEADVKALHGSSKKGFVKSISELKGKLNKTEFGLKLVNDALDRFAQVNEEEVNKLMKETSSEISSESKKPTLTKYPSINTNEDYDLDEDAQVNLILAKVLDEIELEKQYASPGNKLGSHDQNNGEFEGSSLDSYGLDSFSKSVISTENDLWSVDQSDKEILAEWEADDSANDSIVNLVDIIADAKSERDEKTQKILEIGKKFEDPKFNEELEKNLTFKATPEEDARPSQQVADFMESIDAMMLATNKIEQKATIPRLPVNAPEPEKKKEKIYRGILQEILAVKNSLVSNLLKPFKVIQNGLNSLMNLFKKKEEPINLQKNIQDLDDVKVDLVKLRRELKALVDKEKIAIKPEEKRLMLGRIKDKLNEIKHHEKLNLGLDKVSTALKRSSANLKIQPPVRSKP